LSNAPLVRLAGLLAALTLAVTPIGMTTNRKTAISVVTLSVKTANGSAAAIQEIVPGHIRTLAIGQVADIHLGETLVIVGHQQGSVLPATSVSISPVFAGGTSTVPTEPPGQPKPNPISLILR